MSTAFRALDARVVKSLMEIVHLSRPRETCRQEIEGEDGGHDGERRKNDHVKTVASGEWRVASRREERLWGASKRWPRASLSMAPQLGKGATPN
jgi:hypothetical protein